MTDHSPTYREYYAEISCLAVAYTSKDPEERGGIEDASDWLHETLDGHEFVIYTGKAWAVCWHSQNDIAMFEDMGPVDGVDNLGDLMTKCAYFAMQADVLERAS
jgi:hypothetical protein